MSTLPSQLQSHLSIWFYISFKSNLLWKNWESF